MLTLITGNLKKVENMRRYYKGDITHHAYDLTEIQSLILKEIVKHKVLQAFEIVKGPVLAEDVAYTIHAMGNLPGPLIKWFLQELKPLGICQLASQYTSQAVTAEVMYGYYDGNVLKYFHNAVRGIVSPEPRGENVFGWNATFIPEGSTKTWAEMTDEEQAATSLRKPALEEIAQFLSEDK